MPRILLQQSAYLSCGLCLLLQCSSAHACYFEGVTPRDLRYKLSSSMHAHTVGLCPVDREHRLSSTADVYMEVHITAVVLSFSTKIQHARCSFSGNSIQASLQQQPTAAYTP